MTSAAEETEQDLRLVVIGTSAGGLDALLRLLPGIPDDFAAAILIVQHLPAAANMPIILRALQQKTTLACQIAEHHQTIQPGYIYLPPADHHLLVRGNQLHLSRGARENRWRPGIDPLFRSAAVAFGPAVTGVVLTGLLDDGTSGMSAIKRCGGTVVVQAPADALFPDMPQHVLNNVEVDYQASLTEMGALLANLVQLPLKPRTPVPAEVLLEIDIANRVTEAPAVLAEIGDATNFICPDCGGPLSEIKGEQNPRFRCFTGHTFGAHTLLDSKATEVEEAIWMSVRMLEERRNMYLLMAQRQQVQGSGSTQLSEYLEKAEQAAKYIKHLRDVLAIIQADLTNPGPSPAS